MSNSVTNGGVTGNVSNGLYTIPLSGFSSNAVISYSYPEIIGSAIGTLQVKQDTQGQISPKLYIKYVKSKLTKIQQKKLKSRLAKLQKLVQNAHDMGQISMYENLSSMLAVVIRESEAVACGINTYVDREWINKYMYKVKESPVKFGLLKDFPRTIPDDIRKQIKAVESRKLFDQLHVLYLDYTNQDTRDTKQKIKEKDPILFGTYSYQPDRFYYVCDWVDEYCDLTLDKFVDTIKEEDPEFALSAVPEMDENMFDMIKKEVKDRHDRLSGTNRSNFNQFMTEEDKAKDARKFEKAEEKVESVQELLKKSPWWKRIVGK